MEPKLQISISNTSGADDSLPFAGLTESGSDGASGYTLQVLTGTLKINFMGAAGAYLELGPDVYTDERVPWTVLRNAKIDATSAFTGTLVLWGKR